MTPSSMQHAIAAPPADPAAADRLAALVAEAVADARPPRAPGRGLACRRWTRPAIRASGSLGTALFESVHYRLPAFSDDGSCRPWPAGFTPAPGRPRRRCCWPGSRVQLQPRHESARTALHDLQAAHAARRRRAGC